MVSQAEVGESATKMVNRGVRADGAMLDEMEKAFNKNVDAVQKKSLETAGATASVAEMSLWKHSGSKTVRHLHPLLSRGGSTFHNQ
jgi:hypothetical protein